MTQLPSQVEALLYVDTVVRLMYGGKLGKAELLPGVIIVDGHKAWQYEIQGLPMSRDGRRRWVLDTGETFDTTLEETENTPEKALVKNRQIEHGVPSMDNKRATLNSVKLLLPQEVFSRNLDTNQLSAYIKGLVTGVNTSVEGATIECTLLLHVELAPDKTPKIKIDYQGRVENDTLQALYDTLTKVLAPVVAQDVLPFEALIDVRQALAF